MRGVIKFLINEVLSSKKATFEVMPSSELNKIGLFLDMALQTTLN